MEGGTMSSSTENFSSCVMQEEGASLIPFGAGYAAPPPTPSASCPPPHGFLPARPPLQSKSAMDDDDQFSVPSTSSNTTSPPSKQDLEALAQYLLQQSLHSTPNLLASPSLRRKRQTLASVAAVVHPNNEEDDHVVNSRNDINFEGVVQSFTYAGGFCEESRRGIGKACQEVGAFHVLVQQEDAEEALSILKGRHGVDGESVVEGRLITLSQLLTSTSPCYLHDDLDINTCTFDSGIDATFRDTMTRLASLLSRVSKDVLRILLEDLPIATQANIRDHTFKPLLHIHGNGKQDLNLEDDVVLFISHNIDILKSESSALFLARLGPRLQTWSQGKYKAPLMKTLYSDGFGEICIQFALVQHC